MAETKGKAAPKAAAPKAAAAAPKAPVAKAPAKAAPATPSGTSLPGVPHPVKGFRRKMVGKVIRDKMDKTVVVETVSARRDPLYGKYVRTRQRYKAHDETNQFKIGDEVEIEEHRPLSR